MPARSFVTGCAAALTAASLALAAAQAGAADFRSVADPAAILYDAPSAKSRKLFVVGHGYPLEVVVVVEGWTKVRDANGDLTWIESRQLADRRTVLIKVPLAQIREAADDAAAVVFQAQQSVVLELLEVAGPWLRVRHGDGQAGYLRVTQAWGA